MTSSHGTANRQAGTGRSSGAAPWIPVASRLAGSSDLEAARRSAFTGVRGALLVALFILCSVSPGNITLATILIAANLILSVRSPIIVGASVASAAILVTYALLTAFWSFDPFASVSAAKLIIVSLGVFMVLALGVRSKEDLRNALAALWIATAATSIIFALFASRTIPTSTWAAWADPINFRFNLPGASGNYVAYCIAIGFAALIAWVRMTEHMGLLRWTLALAASAVSLYAVWVAGTRGVLVSFLFVGLLAATPLDWAAKLRRALSWTLLVLAALTITGLLQGFLVWSNLESLFSRETGNLSNRVEIWDASVSMIAGRPALGYGIGGYEKELGNYLWDIGVDSHNVVLAIVLGTGIIGLLLYALFVYFCITSRSGSMGAESSFLVVVMIAASIPIWMTGVWEWSPLNWAALGLASSAGRLRDWSNRHA